MAALRSSHQPCDEAAEEMAASSPAAWAAGERGVGLIGEAFSVEELLNLGELYDVEKEVAGLGESPAAADKQSSDSHGSSSVVSYELMPLPPPVIELPVSV